MAASAHKPRNAVESLRDIVQDLLVPELRALKVEVEGLRTESRNSIDALRTESRTSIDALRTESRSSVESLLSEMRLRDEKQAQAIQNLSDKLGYMMDVRERLAVLEDRVPRATS